jgi:predicted O-linked N-acetylglucosamine transferase (SPINDLY family)
VEVLRRAHAANPDAASARWLARAQLAAGSMDEAQQTLADGLAVSPDSAELTTLQADVALRRGNLDAAQAILDAAITTAPETAALVAKRGHLHLLAGAFAEARRDLSRAVELDPADLATRSDCILAASQDPAVATRALKGLQRRLAPPPLARPPAFRIDRTLGRPLRVGYVSSAFHRHATSKVIAAVLLRHDPARVQTWCYSAARRRDAASLRFRMAAKAWRGIAGISDADVAQAIRDDGIDILVDLDGHYAGNRLGIFAHRAAPVQVSAWGYVSGPGWPGIDYLLTDQVVVPRDERGDFPERLIDLPCAQPYDAALMTRTPSGAPAPDGPIRFGCFNRFDKLSPETLALWARVLSASPGATLLLKNLYFAEAGPRERVVAALGRGGVDPNRVTCEAAEAQFAYLGAFSRVDVALDPFPVSGGVTTLDGLSQDVPAVTLAGPQPTGRITASILTWLGLADCIAASPDDYVRLAVELGRDPARLAALRGDVQTAWSRFSPAAMQGYASAVEDIYDEIWARYLAETPAA